MSDGKTNKTDRNKPKYVMLCMASYLCFFFFIRTVN